MKFTQKKISIILPSLAGGGAERININLAERFIELGYAVQLVLFQKKGELLSLVPDEVEVINLNAEKLRDGFKPLRKYISKEKPDALLAAMWPVSVIAIWAARLSNNYPQVVVSEHTSFSQSPILNRGINKWLMPFSMKVSYPLADTVIGVSKGVLEDLEYLSGSDLKNGCKVYNPAAPDTSKVQSIETDYSIWKNSERKKIIAIGSLKVAKDYPTLIESFDLIQEKIKAELLILGEGDERSKLENLINERNLGDLIHLPGFVPDPLQYLKGADLFVLSSSWEGFGNVIVEALACGVPVVSTDCKSGPAEILDDGKYGRLVPVGDSDAIANAILEELEKEHDTEKLKERARDFSIEKIADQYLELLFPVNTTTSN